MAEEQQIQPLVTVPMDLVGVVQVDAADMALRIRGADLLKLISQLDEEVGSYYFTELLHRQVTLVREAQRADRPEVEAMDDDELVHRLSQEDVNGAPYHSTVDGEVANG